MKDIDLLLPQVMTNVPACPEIMAVRFLREAAAEFCQRTRIWKATSEFTITTPAQQDIPAIDDAQVFEIRHAILDETELTPISADELDDKAPRWQFDTAAASPKYLTQTEPNTVSIYPRATGELKLSLVLEPSTTTLVLPDYLVELYRVEIGIGASAKALLANTEFANPNLGAALSTEFQRLLGLKSYQISKGQQGGKRRSRANFL